MVKAILWDFDGTIADSVTKNMNVTLDILRSFFPNIDEQIPLPLQSRSSYIEINGRFSDWKELYAIYYNMTEEQIRKSGDMWRPYQLKDKTPLCAFEGLYELFTDMFPIKMGICSQNDKEVIESFLTYNGIEKFFGSVIGFSSVPYEKQKPDPQAFTDCLDELGIDDRNGDFIYIGDHSVDVAFGRNAEKVLKKDFPNARVTCIAVHYPGFYSNDSTELPPDFSVKTALELHTLLNEIIRE